MIDRDFLRGFVKLYALWRSSKAPVHGAAVTAGMRSLGFELSPGTLYPALHKLMSDNDLTVRRAVIDGRTHKLYRITPKGRRELAELQARLKVLVREVFS